MNPFKQQAEIAFAREQLFQKPKNLWATIYADVASKPWLDLQEATLFVIEMEAEEDELLKQEISKVVLGSFEQKDFSERLAA